MKARLLAGTLAELESDYKLIGQRLFVARIRYLVTNHLDQLGYLGVDVKAISSSWTGGGDLAPLRVMYPGFGVPMYLAPSPASQLTGALFATGEDKVFASGSSFIAGYRTAVDGVEAPIVAARTIRLPFDELLGHALGALNRVSEVLDLEPVGRNLPVREYPLDDRTNPTLLEERPEVQVFKSPLADRESTRLEVFRVVLGKGVIPCEGVIENSVDGAPLGTLSIYPERILPLLQHVPIRTLRDLSP